MRFLRQKIFRFFILMTTVLLLISSLIAFLGANYIKTSDEISKLDDLTNLIGTAVDQHGYSLLPNLDTKTFRITLISEKGNVIFDNTYDPNALENHANRKEIQDAIKTGQGSSIRYSNTMNKQTFYHAVRLKDRNILRLSFSHNIISYSTSKTIVYFVSMMFLIITICAYIARVLAHNITDPINKIDLNHPHQANAYAEFIPLLNRIKDQQRMIDMQMDKLRRKNHEFSVITKNMSDGLVLLNSSGYIISINKTARRIFSITKENSLNQSYLNIEHFEDLQSLMEKSVDHPSQVINLVRDSRNYEIRFEQIIDNRFALDPNKRSILGYALIILDVTDKINAEKQRQEFTANVSHELKTPLQSIIGYSELMANNLVQPEDIPSFAQRINLQSSRLKTLIEDLIFLSSLDESNIATFETVNVRQITQEVFDNLYEKALKRNVKLKYKGDVLSFRAVNRYIFELIYNLVDNGIAYNKENGQVEVITSTKPNLYIIEVKDTGMGISPEHQTRIFERFYRVDKSHSRQTGGTGLGLSIVKRVVMYHNGKIELKSKPEKGSTFKITLYQDRLTEIDVENQKKQEEFLRKQDHIV